MLLEVGVCYDPVYSLDKTVSFCPASFCRTSLVAQMVRNPPAIQETGVPSPGWKDPLKNGMATHSSILAWRI